MWRPQGVSTGCYRLVGENSYVDIQLVRGLVNETAPPSNIITFQPGDVVGYYTSNKRRRQSGIQLDNSYINERVWYHINNETDPLITMGGTCPYRIGSEADRILRSFTNAGPILSVGIGK